MTVLTGVLCVRVTDAEFRAFQVICDRAKVSRQEMLRAILVDILVEEGFDGLRRWEPEGRSGSGEDCETCGATTP